MIREKLELDIKTDTEALNTLRATISKEEKILTSRIKTNKKELTELQENDKYADYDETMRAYYTHSLGNREATDWYDFIGGNEFLLLGEVFDDMYNLNRYETYDVDQLIFESGYLQEYLEKREVTEEVMHRVLDEWACYKPDSNIKKLSDLSDSDREELEPFFKEYVKLNYGTVKNDW